MTNSVKMLIGTSSDGKPLYLEYALEETDLEKILIGFSLREQVEILCILDYTLLKRLRNKVEYRDSKTLSLVHSYLESRRKKGDFSTAQEEMGLRTPLDRVRYGQELSL